MRSSTSSPGISDVVAIAPALTIGLAGRPVPASRLIALNGSPLGSAPTLRQHRVAAALGERQREHERLRDRLDGELGVVVADGPHPAARADDREREQFGIGVGELGDVRRRGPAAARPDLFEHLAEQRVMGSTARP